MNVWMNKNTGDLVLATPHWEPLHIEHDKNFYEEVLPEIKELSGGRRLVHGTLMQVGWLIQNSHNIWLGVHLSVTEDFEDLGEV
jgi:hypothetical protein